MRKVVMLVSFWVGRGQRSGPVRLVGGDPRALVAGVVLLFLLSLQAPILGQSLDFAFPLGGTGDDGGSDMVLDSSGNIYVSGGFSGTVDFDPGPGVFELTGGGGFLAKYDNSGAFQWVIPAVGGRIALDGGGNIYLTGGFSGTVDFDPGPGVFELTSGGSLDIFVAKLDNSGTFQWAHSMGGTAGWESGLDVAVDSSTNSCVVTGGEPILVAKYDSAGSLEWEFWVALAGGGSWGTGVAVDGVGSVYLTGNGNGDFDPGPGVFEFTSYPGGSLAKYSSSGAFEWAFRTGGQSDVDSRVALDGSDNVYVTSSFDGTQDFDPGPGVFELTTDVGLDMFLAKYDSSGGFHWAVSASGPGNEYFVHLAVDDSGNSYVGGLFDGETADFSGTMFTNQGMGHDAFLASYDSSGKLQWALSVGGPESDGTGGVAADSMGNAYVTGTFGATVDFDPGPGVFNLTSAGGSDIFVAKYNPPPTCEAGASYVAECAGATTTVDLDGSASFDPGGEPLEYSWTTDCPGGSFDDSTSATPTLSVDSSSGALVECTVSLTVTDVVGNAVTCSADVTVEDTTPPEITCQDPLILSLFIEETPIHGRQAWKTVRIPTDEKSGYSKQTVWIDLQYLSPVRIEYFDRKGDLQKTADFVGYQRYGTYWRPTEISIVNHQTKKSSRLIWKERKLQVELDESEFDQDELDS